MTHPRDEIAYYYSVAATCTPDADTSQAADYNDGRAMSMPLEYYRQDPYQPNYPRGTINYQRYLKESGEEQMLFPQYGPLPESRPPMTFQPQCPETQELLDEQNMDNLHLSALRLADQLEEMADYLGYRQ